MKITKISNFTGLDDRNKSFKKEHLNDFVFDVDKDLRNFFLLAQGRVRFGNGVDGERGENVSGEFQTIITSGTPDAENTLAHGLGAVPVGYIVLNQDKAASLYSGASAWTASNIYLKSNVATVTFTIFLLK